jgi:decaprenylphospho-beta-D-ribofuranose 2-oxidase
MASFVNSIWMPSEMGLTEMTGWARYPRQHSRLLKPTKLLDIQNHMSETGVVARGNGRAYCDAAIGQRVTVSTLGLDRIRAFDRSSGVLTVEAGLLLSELLALVVPLGFFPSVVPGTKFVTIGGMVASDVHGKNHHRVGGFGEQVNYLTLLLPDGRDVRCSRDENSELFFSTIGGMGLTGTILDVTFRLNRIETGWLRQTTNVAPNLEAALGVLTNDCSATYSVAWIDCLARGPSLGRSLIFSAEHATDEQLRCSKPEENTIPAIRLGRVRIPINFPAGALNRFTVAALNAIYYTAGARNAGREQLVAWDPYFFPLDAIESWDRIYGARGFLQYQCVIPTSRAANVLMEILDRVATGASGCFLAVLKQLGPSHGLLSFPLAGYTLTLDFPVSGKIFPLLNELDTLVMASGGRLYLAKDARQSRDTFEAGYPRLHRFRELRRSIAAEGNIVSFMSARLGIE